MKTPLVAALIAASVAVPSAAPAPTPLSSCSVDGHLHLNAAARVDGRLVTRYDEAAKAGIAVFREDHPFESAPPDHELFLLLADIAARVNLPIDLHMEAVVAGKPFTNVFPTSRNPQTLTANIAAFERLLRHNRRARIVWAHAGWDNTGDMTVALLRRLLKTHPNLYLGLKLPPSLHPENGPIASDGSVRPEWLKLLREFPTRVVVGSDEFLPPPGAAKQFPRSAIKTWQFVARWPADVAKQVACENPKRIYR